MTANLRLERGQAIATCEGQIKRIDEHAYEVRSQSGNGVYQIISTEFGWGCSCLDNQYRRIDCKHILAVQISLELRRTVENQIIIKALDTQACPFCKSERIIHKSIRVVSS